MIDSKRTMFYQKGTPRWKYKKAAERTMSTLKSIGGILFGTEHALNDSYSGSIDAERGFWEGY